MCKKQSKEEESVKKTLYSLLLDDAVVREIDRIAHRTGLSRSALVNRVLADYANMTTPETKVGDVFRAIEALLQPDSELVPFFAPNGMTMSLKSSLDYKYRPTVKYEVELYRGGEDKIGELSVVFRTQSAALLEAMTGFFRLWKTIEDSFLAPRLGAEIPCALFENKFVRAITAPKQSCTTDELAETISSYVRLFDRLMKGYLAGRISAPELARSYESHISRAKYFI